MKAARCCIVVVMASTLPAVAAHAADENTSSVRGVLLQWENDFFGTANTDRWYTNGLRLAWTYDKDAVTAPARTIRDAAEWFGAGPAITYSVGQTMYTPRKISIVENQPKDRPWGAFLYFGIGAHADIAGGREFRTTELKLGVSGPRAYGANVQRAWHELLGGVRPMGWHNQLKSRPGLQLSHGRTYRPFNDIVKDRIAFQPGWGIATGTLRTYGSVNASLIFGDLSGSENDQPVLIGNEGDFVMPDAKRRSAYRCLYGFVGASATAVGFNYFLRGRTPHGRAEIDPKRGHLTTQWGVSLPLHRWLDSRGAPRLVYTQTRRSPEFTVPGLGRDDGYARYGALTAHWALD